MKSRPVWITVLILALLTAISAAGAANVRPVSFATAGEPVKLLNNSDFGFDLDFLVHDYALETISTKLGDFDQISIEGYGHSNRIGEPMLPVYSKLISVPLGAELSFEITKQQQLNLGQPDNRLEHRIIPAQPSVSKSENPAFIAFQINNDVYTRNAFADMELFHVEEVGMMRAVRVFRIEYRPVNYNPVTGELQITNAASIRVSFAHPDLAASEELMAKTGSVEYDNLYASTFLNWDTNTRTSLVRNPTKMLILCPPNYTDEMQTFVDWKKQQGDGQ